MKKLKLSTKPYLLILVLLIIGYFNLDYLRAFARENLPYNVKIYIKTKFFGKKYLDEINYFKLSNYNQKILPETEFLNLKIKKIEVQKLKLSKQAHYNPLINKDLKKKFFITIYNDKIILIDSAGTIIQLDDIKNLQEESIKNNIKELNTKDIKDAHIIDNNLFISYSYSNAKNCDYFRIAKADLKQRELNFEIFFDSKECNKNVIAGRMSEYALSNDKKGLLVTTGSDGTSIIKVAQKNESIYGKILFFNLSDKSYQIVSKGHRNPQGLTVIDDKILSTEHGPKGGDEINLIKIGSNYGWPVASYGEPYKYSVGSEYKFKKNHYKNNFEEPIFSFVPSIGISQLIHIPDNFSTLWSENFFISSLNARSLFRVKFDKNFTKLIFKEKIIIGERIRDITYFEKFNTFLVALEDSGSIGFISMDQ